jgi:undecaprenyl-diphosphatase
VTATVRRTRPRATVVLGFAAGAAVALAVAVLALTATGGPLTAPKAIVLGAVEGITEYLPVSSTGHLLVVERLLGLGTGSGKAAADTYAVAIQLGAILAVVALYRRRIGQMAAGLVGRDRDGRRLLCVLAIAFVPAALAGVLLEHAIKAHLFGPWPVVAAWVAGALFLLWWRPPVGRLSLEAVPLRGALLIGTAQSLALWPGVSRSLVTIVAAMAVGCELLAAVELSFLLGLATLSAATALDLAKHGSPLLADYGWATPLLGGLVAFATALVAVRWLVTYLRTRPLTIFAWYRIGAAAVTTALLLGGVI